MKLNTDTNTDLYLYKYSLTEIREEHDGNKGQHYARPFKPKRLPCSSGPYSFISYRYENKYR